ncbi:MAG: hypothetical protein MUP63_04275, partial [Candidatus Nanohaloarchaeota archaeon QJJ-7]|nr:hypothetical protein [Candidatus Nanohaloarchaeota archaeon QJJ-7]
MEWYASENLEEAYTSTKDFLLPFNRGIWARMAVVVFLTGGFGFGSFSNIFSNIPSGSTPSSISTAGAPAESGSLTGAVTGMASMEPVVISLAVFFLLIILGFMYVSSVFEFVFYKSIREQEVNIRE